MPNALILQNQLGREIARLDENGNLSISGKLISQDTFAQADATSSLSDIVTADFADASDAVQTALQAITATAVRMLGDAIYAIYGMFDTIFAKSAHLDQLCVGATCVTPAQFQAMVAAAGQSSAAGSNANGATSTPAAAVDATNTPPVIQINGENPARINAGDNYNDLGATITGPQADLNLGIHTFLNGALVSDIVLDTTQVATDTIDYVATDGAGLTATSTRTVLIEPVASSTPQSLPITNSPPLVPTNSATSTAATTSQ